MAQGQIVKLIPAFSTIFIAAASSQNKLPLSG